jgi:hypothetical protein
MGAWSPSSNNTRAQFDLETFKKLVARFDSNHAAEAETAFRKAMTMCVQAHLRFCDAVSQAYAQGNREAELESELAAVREHLDQREREGAALADARDRLEQEFVAYRQRAEQEFARLRQAAGRGIGQFCRGCERKRALLALIAAWPIAKLWFSHGVALSALGFPKLGPWKSNLLGVFLVGTPLLAVLCRWRWLTFKRRYAWVSWRDNDIYRNIAAQWNAFLERLTLT